MPTKTHPTTPVVWDHYTGLDYQSDEGRVVGLVFFFYLITNN